jgi:predicted nucleic acid-binding protein
MRIYVDTNVIMDFLLDRRSSAYDLFRKTFGCAYTIVVSDVVLIELEFQKMDYENLFKLLESAHKLEIVKSTTSDINSAKLIITTHYNDALHYLLAKRAHVECIVTSNIKDFSWFDDLSVKRPDDL